MRVLVTGANGFLGRVIDGELKARRKDVTTLGRSIANDVVCDLTREVPRIIQTPDWVVHNAGKAHVVPRSDEEAKDFFDVNVNGTKNLLKGIESTDKIPKAFVFISSVSVYGLSSGVNIAEDHPLNATDPYGRSKVEAEKMLAAWCNQHSVSLIILRLPLIAGENPPGNLGAMIKGIRKGYYFGIAGSKARKSIVMASDVAKAIPDLVDHPGVYHLTDGHHPSFKELEDVISSQLGCSSSANLPGWVARCLGVAGDLVDKVVPGKSPVTTTKLEKITSTLTFDDSKVRKIINWQPQRVIDAFRI